MKNFGMGTKILACFTLLASLLFLFGIVSLVSFNKMEASFTRAVNQTTRKLVLADDISTGQSEMLSSQRGMIQWALMKDPARTNALKEKFHQIAAKQQSSLAEMRPMLVTSEGKQLTEQSSSDVRQWEQVFTEIEQLMAAGHEEQALQLSATQTLPISDRIDAAAARMRAINLQLLENDKKAAIEQFSACRWLSLLVFALAVCTGIFTVLLVHRVCGELSQVANELASGSEQVASAAQQVSSSSQVLAQGASEQAASLEETSSSTLEINSMTRNNADNSKSAAALVIKANEGFAATNLRLREMVVSMEQINASSDKIAKIIKIIDDIAFQTNILALNAAVEAARAGEAGMGFAVVADEVRNLAQRCAQAAKDTAELIEDSIHKCHEGSKKLEGVEASIQQLSSEAQQIKVLVEEVSVASQEQARGLDQINRAVGEMEQVTQRTAANSEESAAAGEELTAQAEALRHIVQELTQMVQGGDVRGGAAIAPEASAWKAVVPAPVKSPRPAAEAVRRLLVSRKAPRVPVPSSRPTLREQIVMEEEFQEIL